MNIVIAISKGSGDQKYLNYAAWLKRLQPDVICKDLSVLPLEEAMQVIRESNGLLLAGGPDIDPSRYNRSDARNICECDMQRDKDEWAYVDVALREKKPILGVCRGMQLLNIYFGGMLIPDLPSAGYTRIVHGIPTNDVQHDVTVTNPLFEEMLSISAGAINSHHHQAVTVVAPPFVAYAKSMDGVVEAMGTEDLLQSFIVAVQWHPERMEITSPFSHAIGSAFLQRSQCGNSSIW